MLQKTADSPNFKYLQKWLTKKKTGQEGRTSWVLLSPKGSTIVLCAWEWMSFFRCLTFWYKIVCSRLSNYTNILQFKMTE